MPRLESGSRTARWMVLGLGLLAVWLVTSATRGDEPAADLVLRQKGLTRNGPVYLLKGEDELKQQVDEVRRLHAGWDQAKQQLAETLGILDQAQLRYQEVVQRQKALEEQWQTVSRQTDSRPPPDFKHSRPPLPPDFHSPGPPPPDFHSPGPPPPGDMTKFGPADRDRYHQQIRQQYRSLQAARGTVEAQIVRSQFSSDDLAGRLETKLREIERRRVEVARLDEEIRGRYATLAAESEVKRALATINETSDPHQARLGPREDHAKDLEAMSSELLEVKRLMEKHRGRVELKGMSRITGLAGAAEALQTELGIALWRLQTLEHNADYRRKMLADLASREQNQAAELGRAADSAERERIAVQLDTKKVQAEKLRAEQTQAPATMREALEQVVTAREDYLRLVAALRDAISRRADPSDDSLTRQEILKPLPGEKKMQVPSSEQINRRLNEFEKTISTEKVAGDPDRTILWVDAALNGKAGQKMIVDPGAEDVRLSARVAEEAGVRPAESDPIVEITTHGGRTIAARKTRLTSVQVGSCTAIDVDCLVLPVDYGETPSLLGGSFLKRFATSVDPEAGTLILTQVQVKPINRQGKGPATRPATAGSPKGNSKPSTLP